MRDVLDTALGLLAVAGAMLLVLLGYAVVGTGINLMFWFFGILEQRAIDRRKRGEEDRVD